MVKMFATFSSVDAADRAACRIAEQFPEVQNVELHGAEVNDFKAAEDASFIGTAGGSGLLGAFIAPRSPQPYGGGEIAGFVTLSAPKNITARLRGTILNLGGFDVRP